MQKKQQREDETKKKQEERAHKKEEMARKKDERSRKRGKSNLEKKVKLLLSVFTMYQPYLQLKSNRE